MSDMPLKEPCPSEKEKPEKQSIARELRKRKTRLQNRARRLTKRIRDSAFPPNTIDYMWDMYEKRGSFVESGPSFVLSRLEKQISLDLSDEGRILAHALTTLGVFGAAHMEVLKGICSNAQPMEYFDEGETICLVSDETIDLTILVSGSATIYMQVDDNLGNTTEKQITVRDKPGSLLTSITDILSMVVHCESDGSIPRLSPLDLRVKAETRCSIVRVKSSKVIEFLRVNVDLSTRAHMVRMMLIRLGQLSFMVAYRYFGLIHSILNPLEPISPKDATTCCVSECSKDEDIVNIVSRSLGLPDSDSEQVMIDFPIFHEGGEGKDTTPQNEMDGQGKEQKIKLSPSTLDMTIGMHVIQLKSGDTLMAGQNPRPCFFVVLSGCLKISITEKEKILFTSSSESGQDSHSSSSNPTSSILTGDPPANNVHSYGPGSVIGLAALLMGATPTVYYSPDDSSPPMLSVQAHGPTSVMRMSAETHDILISKYPVIVEHVAQSLIQRLPKVIQLIDRASTYVELEASEVLIRKDEPSHSLYFVLHGKLIATSPSDATELACGIQKGQSNDEVLWAYRRGAVIGESEILAQGPNLTDVTAERPSKLVQFTGSTLAFLYSLHPSIVASMASAAVLKRSSHRQGNAGLHHMGHARSFFIVPASPGAGTTMTPTLYQFVKELGIALCSIGRTPGMICPRVVARHMGVNLDDGDRGRGASFSNTILQAFSSWIPALEEKNDVVLYCAEDKDFPWAKDYNLLCKQQADVVLLVVDASDVPQLSHLERELGVGLSKCAQYFDNTLIVLHKDPPEGYSPTNTRNWFAGRSIQRHYHIRMQQSKQLGSVGPSSPDFLRVARCLTGQGLGLVLGGGGARGFSHVGLLRVLEEEKIPVDIIVGTSIGAFVGGLYAFDNLISRIVPITQDFSKRMRLTGGLFKDLTFPITSYFSGAYMNMFLMKAFQSRGIEDSWIPFACTSTDIVDAESRVHTHGTTWRYVRASMTVVGIFPPICEKFKDSSGETKVSYLIDGGYVSATPVDTVRSLGAWTVIAADIFGMPQITSNMANFGDSLSGIWSFISRFFSNIRSKIPSHGVLLAELAFLTSTRERNATKILPRDLYLRPPIHEFSTWQFECFSTIMERGYVYAQKHVRKWKEQNQKTGELCAVWPEQISIEDREALLCGFSEIQLKP